MTWSWDLLELAEQGKLHMKHKSFNNGYDANGSVDLDEKIWFPCYLRQGEGIANVLKLKQLEFY